ncbi:DUF1858 domain-containing protein [Bacillus sp. CLL-7-23]|uniref:DUF1858 domain-containing protein n=1 Tax=Bacillus changyiensis TaxID=3004103 RepID=A0ABT4X6L9_9BACI|nr:DUF1858 domain-containing protein [Bacillus changyiensis]MDA7027931.1 DUF1858 domain-containing protein [Bacillus changyiensis]
MKKILYLHDTVYELCTSYPELKTLMKDLGFENITKPGMLETAGRIMTIPKGARMKKIDLDHVINQLKEHGFDPVWEGETQ